MPLFGRIDSVPPLPPSTVESSTEQPGTGGTAPCVLEGGVSEVRLEGRVCSSLGGGGGHGTGRYCWAVRGGVGLQARRCAVRRSVTRRSGAVQDVLYGRHGPVPGSRLVRYGVVLGGTVWVLTFPPSGQPAGKSLKLPGKSLSFPI